MTAAQVCGDRRGSAPVAGCRAASGNDGWEDIGCAIDLFALSDLTKGPPGHGVADRAAAEMRRRLG